MYLTNEIRLSDNPDYRTYPFGIPRTFNGGDGVITSTINIENTDLLVIDVYYIIFTVSKVTIFRSPKT
jgi:hypothetical protein